MLRLLQDLTTEGFQVWRYKIEDALLDSRHDDMLFRLNVKREPGLIQ